jgi:uncharacterized protein
MGHGISVMWKTVSNTCNMACDYCYFEGSSQQRIADTRIPLHVLDAFMKPYMEGTDGVASFAWQGGEPLLAGTEFFHEVIRLQAKYAPPHTSIGNALQTNGTLINEQWAQLFKQYNFLIGVSIDGPKEIHNQHRPFGSGNGSFDAIMQGIDWLRKYKVDFNILTVVHADNVNHVDELMAFYEQEGFDYIQFIPCMDFTARNHHQSVSYAITPQQYGDFLCRAFDLWIGNGRPTTSIRFFDNLLSVYVNHRMESCIHSAECSRTLILESNGDAYPCDFYMGEAYKLGNVAVDSLQDILDHPAYKQFHLLKRQLPEACKSCEYLSLCHGGCPRNRTYIDTTQPVSPDYFCASYRQIYAYAHERLQTLALLLRQEWKLQYATSGRPLPERNDPCYCGSGKKYKHCCLEVR